MKTFEERLDRIEQILMDNKQHQRFCPALVTATQAASTGGMFFMNSEKYCDCWISAANPSTDSTKGFGVYEKTEERLWNRIFPSRYDAVNNLTLLRSLSRDQAADNYYGKDFLITEVIAKPAETPTTEI